MLLVFQECKIAAVLEDSYHFKLIGDKGFLIKYFLGIYWSYNFFLKFLLYYTNRFFFP